MLFKAIGVAVLFAVPGTIFGLIFMSSTFYQRMYGEGKLRKVVGLPFLIAIAVGLSLFALDMRYDYETSSQAYVIIAGIIFFIGLGVGYSLEGHTGKK